MKKVSIYLAAALCSSLALTSCSDDDVDPIVQTVTIDSSTPTGTTTTVRSGDFVEDSAPSTGTASIVEDSNGDFFIQLSSDFTTNVATGTVSIFLAKSNTFSNATMPDGSQKVVGFVNDNGEAFFKLDAEPSADYTHLILWCSTANLQFGNAELK